MLAMCTEQTKPNHFTNMGVGSRKSTTANRRISDTVDGKIIHLETHQQLYHSSLLYTVYRHRLEPQEKFSADKALQVLEKHHRKKQALCVACLLEDRMVLEKTSHSKEPFRSWVAYKEIVDFRRDSKRKDMFVLMINAQTSNARYYEVYRCTPKDNITHYERIIRKGMQDPEGVARAEESEGLVEVSEPTDRPRTLAHFEFQTSMEAVREEEVANTVERGVSPIVPAKSATGIWESPSTPVKVKQNFAYAAPPTPPSPRSPSPELIMKQRTITTLQSQPPIASPPAQIPVSYSFQQPRMRSPSPVMVQKQPVVKMEQSYQPQLQTPQKQLYSPSPKANYWPTSPVQRRMRTIEKLDQVTYVNYGYAGSDTNNKRGPVYLYVSSEQRRDEPGPYGASSMGRINGYSGYDDDEDDY